MPGCYHEPPRCVSQAIIDLGDLSLDAVNVRWRYAAFHGKENSPANRTLRPRDTYYRAVGDRRSLCVAVFLCLSSGVDVEYTYADSYAPSRDLGTRGTAIALPGRRSRGVLRARPSHREGIATLPGWVPE